MRVARGISLGALALLWASAATLPGERGGAGPAAVERSAPRADGVPASCGPGPLRVSEMQYVPSGGYMKARRSGSQPRHEFNFARAMYSEGGGGFGFRGSDWLGDGGPAWSIDYPSADRHMMLIAKRLSNLDACEWGQPISLADPDLRRYPFLYSLEWGWALLSEPEVLGLRGYLQAGGFLMLDDFWGTAQWANMERQMRRVLPNRPIVDIPRDHVLFRSYYRIDGPILQVPGRGNGRAVAAGDPRARTWEQDGYEPYIRGIFDDAGRLMVVIFANADLGDALEWADDPMYPLRYSTFASELFLNTIVHAMTY
jgi:hypothetical protein